MPVTIEPIIITLTHEEAEYLHELLSVDRSQHTRNGQIWSLHQSNAWLRTKLERAASDAREENP